MNNSKKFLPLVLVVGVVIILACGVEMPAPITGHGAPHYADLESAKMVASRNNQAILLDFYTDQCPWCKRLDTVVFIDQKAIDYFTNDMVLAKIAAERDSSYINEDGDTVITTVKTDINNLYKVSAYPTLVLVNAQGVEIDRIVGYLEVDVFIKTLNNYQNGIGTLEDLLLKAKDSKDRTLFLEIADKYKYRGEPENATSWYEKIIDAGDARDSLSGDSRLALADMKRRAKEYDEALEGYRAIEKDFKDSPFGADAIIWQAIVYRSMDDTTKAITTFEKFIRKYPDSGDVDYAKDQIEKLSVKEEK